MFSVELQRVRSLCPGEVKDVIPKTYIILARHLQTPSFVLDVRKNHRHSPFYDLPKSKSDDEHTNLILHPKLPNRNFRKSIGNCLVCSRNYKKGILEHINSKEHVKTSSLSVYPH